MPAIPIIMAATAVAGAVSTADAQRKAAHAAQDAAKATTGEATQLDINALDAQARDFARKNAADSKALEDQYSPGVGNLRTGSIQELLANLNGTPQANSLTNRIASSAGTPLTVGGPTTYDSPLVRAAVAKAQSDLALGGQLDQETRNAVARHAAATSGRVTGNLGLGRDLTLRDLGLTSLQLQQQRLQNASSVGAQEAALAQGNAAFADANAARSLQAQQFGRTNLLDSSNVLAGQDNSNFARILAAAQFAQNIAQPKVGLDPSSVVNLAIANKNAGMAGAQQAAGLQSAAANNQGQAAGQVIGTSLGFLQDYLKSRQPAPATTYYTPPANTLNYTSVAGPYG